MLIIYSIIYFIANGISAYSMSAEYGKDSAYAYLFYGICAYALPVLIGIVCDVVTAVIKQNTGLIRRRFYWGITVLGVIFTLLGLFFGLYALGAGSALVSVGCGMGCMHDDSGKSKKIPAIGICLAAGVPGAWVGDVLADFTSWQRYVQNTWITLMLIMIICGFMYILIRERTFQFVSVKQEDNVYTQIQDEPEETESGERFDAKYIFFVTACVLSSTAGGYIAALADYDWRIAIVPSVAVFTAMTVGRIAGGILTSVLRGIKCVLPVVAGICAAAGICAWFSEYEVLAIIAVLLINILLSYVVSFITTKYKKLRGISLGMTYLGFLVSYLIVYMIK